MTWGLGFRFVHRYGSPDLGSEYSGSKKSRAFSSGADILDMSIVFAAATTVGTVLFGVNVTVTVINLVDPKP